MKENVSIYKFRDTMVKYGFSYHGANALYEYLEQFEEDTGHELEFDPVSLNCDFTEYESEEELLSQYNNCETLEDIEYNTSLIRFKKEDYLSNKVVVQERFIIRNF